MPWRVGDLITGRYEIERRLGGGSMGDVFLAEDRLLKKPVALKVLRPELAQNRDTVRRFLREVALAHSVTHQNVVRIYDTGEERGLPFFTMEVLQGQVLDELLEGPDGKPVHAAERMPIRKIRSIAFDVLDAMEAAHRAGVVHRDLKPGNVMLTHRGAIVMDFGVAGIDDIDRAADPPSTSSLRSLVRTEVGTIFGSPAYMAPELWEGQAATVQSDLYAFGVMLYQMLTGRLPFSAKTPAAFVEKLSTAPPPPLRSLRRDVPWNLVRLVRRCMARDPEVRPTSAANAANLISPLRGRQRRRFAWGASGVAAVVVGSLWFRATPSWRDLGLPDALAEAELAAAVRSFDVGERGAALRRLDRLAVRAPDSAGLAFWRATVLHDIGDPRGRLARCGGPEPRGSATWIEMAQAACEATYRIAEPGEQTLDDGPRAVGHELVPLAVEWSLLPKLDAEPSNPEVLSLAETVLDRMADEPEWENDWITPVRWRLARQHLAAAVGSAPPKRKSSDDDERFADAPAILEGDALRALLDGDEQSLTRLAGKLRPLDPTLTVRRQMHDGRMEDAWASIEELGDDDPFVPGLVSMWCGYQLRFEVPSRPPRCDDLPPGLTRALWDVREGRPADVAALDAGSAAVVRRYAAVEAGRCAGVDKRAPRLRTIAPPFETFAAEIELTAALCPASPSFSDPKRANELANALVQLSPNDPWVHLAAGPGRRRRPQPPQACRGQAAAGLRALGPRRPHAAAGRPDPRHPRGDRRESRQGHGPHALTACRAPADTVPARDFGRPVVPRRGGAVAPGHPLPRPRAPAPVGHRLGQGRMAGRRRRPTDPRCDRVVVDFPARPLPSRDRRGDRDPGEHARPRHVRGIHPRAGGGPRRAAAGRRAVRLRQGVLRRLWLGRRRGRAQAQLPGPTPAGRAAAHPVRGAAGRLPRRDPRRAVGQRRG